MKVHVNLTTWAKRDKYVPTMLEHFKKQTLKADKIILWLSREEYDEHHLPEHLAKCLTDGLLTDIMWVDKNTYCHKRHECFKYYDDVWNMFIDDDIFYHETFLQELIDGASQRPDCITSYVGNKKVYVGTECVQSAHTDEPSFENGPMGCWMCVPPGVFPKESYAMANLRDRYCPKCDESWLAAWGIKKGIKFHNMHTFQECNQKNIGATQDDALYNENKKRVEGIRLKDRMIANAIKVVGVEKAAKKVWPDFDIDKTASFKEYENIIVAMTSWPKRIANVPKVIDSLLANTMPPDKVILTLAEEEFPGRVIPADVEKYFKEHAPKVQINWVKENTKVWKKIIPAFRLFPKDAIITADDDRIYNENYIRTLWLKHLEFPNNPVTATVTVINGFIQHGGCCTLEKLEYYGDILQVLDEHPEIMSDIRSSDTFFQYMAIRHGTPCISAGPIQVAKEIFNETEPWHTTVAETEYCWNYMRNLYGNPNENELKGKKEYLPYKVSTFPTTMEQLLIRKYQHKHPGAKVTVENGWLFIRKGNAELKYKL